MRRLFHLWRNLTRKEHVDEEMDAELRSYLELVKEEKIKAGLDPQRAQREALMELGGVEQVKEGIRDVRAGRLLENLSSDVRHAWRMIFKMRLTAIVVILSLGVGIGVNTTIFTWIQAVIFEPLPGVADGSTFQHVEVRSDTGAYPGMSWLEYRDVRERTSSFRDLLAFRMVPFYVGETGRTERVYGLLVSGNYFSTLGLTPALGRFIQPEEVSRPGGEPVVVISYEFWQTHFQSAANVLGQTDSRERLPADDRRGHAETISGNSTGTGFQSVDAGHAGAGLVGRIAGTGRSKPARLRGDGQTSTTRHPGEGAG